MAHQLISVVVICTLITLIAASPSPAQSPRSYTGCSSSADCGQGRCCVIVGGRYPTTACMQRPQAGQQCRPSSSRPTSTTLQFPGGASVFVTDVYKNLCPCESPAMCSSSGTCTR
ncbi:astakine-like [Macrosteles quadrilineatus]|uniref:astakine-like n=1 Tax=Macrosteles quadrilineatus TaxID=74068 RepID=UPI0023E14AF1|nr:astakine-like [Macrosteles quadrilineatus]XP_054258951.1 astakine-like [Macrosteles quadrilineatus]